MASSSKSSKQCLFSTEVCQALGNSNLELMYLNEPKEFIKTVCTMCITYRKLRTAKEYDIHKIIFVNNC